MFRHLKVGDRVRRQLGTKAYDMEVTYVGLDILECGEVRPNMPLFRGGWEFHRDSGNEIVRTDSKGGVWSKLIKE